MVEFKFQWQKFKMEDSAKEFLEKYISKIKKYAESHNVSDDLVDDIYQSILEKLFELKWEISQKKVVQIVNSIWEPEDIFEDESETTLIQNASESNRKNENKSDLKRYENLQKTNWARPRDKSILLWVCAMFGQSTWINRRIWRILALFWAFLIFSYDAEMCFLWICCCWGYILLALIFPIKDKEYKHCSSLVYFATQIRDLRFIVANFFTRFFWICKRVVKTAIPSCIRFLKKLLWPLWTFVKYCFLICRSLFLAVIIIWLWVLLYCLLWWLFQWNWFTLWNIDYLALIPSITKWWVMAWIISAFLLLLASIWSLIKKKLSSSISLIIAIWCGLLAVIVAVISLWEIREIWNVSWTDLDEITKEAKIEIPSNDEKLNILIEDIPYSLLKNAIVSEPRFVNIFPSDDNNLKVVYSFSIKNSNEEYISQVKENLSDIDYDWDWDSFLSIRLKNRTLFSKKTPAVPMNISIDLYVPKDLDIQLLNKWYVADLEDFPSRARDSYHVCETIKYNEKSENFSCIISVNAQDRYNIARQNLQEMADEIVPLKWSNSVWSVSSHVWDYIVDKYRNLDSINIWDDGTLLAKYSDKFFNFFIEIEYSIDDETGEFTLINSQLTEVEQKWLMDSERIKHYTWRENLKDFDIQMKEDEEDKIKKEQEIHDLQDRIKVLEEKLDELTLDPSEV